MVIYHIIAYTENASEFSFPYNSVIKPIDESDMEYTTNAIRLKVMPIDGGEGGGGNPSPPNTGGTRHYPYNCDGTVIMYYETVTLCNCENHLPDECYGCSDGWHDVQIPYYLCEEDDDGDWSWTPPSDPNPTDPTPPTGGGSDNSQESPTITSPNHNLTPQDPEECPNLEGDLDGNCSIDDYEACLLDQNPEQYCECITDENTIDCIIVEDFEEDSKTKCVHESLKSNGNSFTLYDRLLTNFNDYFDDHLILETGNTGTDWGYTTGQAGVDNAIIDNPNFYNVTISETLDQNGSNLAITVTLIHEIMHAYMYQSLFDAGLIDFDENGDPVPVGNLCNLTLSLNNYTIGELFSAYICELNQNNELDEQWTHGLFNTNVFSISTFQQQLADFIYQNHDWSNEPVLFQSLMENDFGLNWQEKVAEIISWRGLETTSEFHNWYINSGYPTNVDENGNTTYPTVSATISLIRNSGNKNCN